VEQDIREANDSMKERDRGGREGQREEQREREG